MMRRAWIRISTCLLLIFTVASSGQAAAQTTAPDSNKSALTVSPAITEDVVPAGKPKSLSLRITNITNFPLPISGTVKNFVPLQQLDDSHEQAKYDASKWFVIADPDFILQPKQTRSVTITITPPSGAEPGGHYATIYFTPLIPETALTPSTAYLSAQVATLAFLIVPGNLTERIQITSLAAPPVSQSRSVDLTLSLKNSGNVHVSPNGYIAIQRLDGKQVAKLPVQPGIVLPGTTKQVTTTWHASSFIGRYTATAHITYGAANTAVRSVSITLWIVPWEALLGIGIPVILVTAIALYTRGRWKKAWRILRGEQ